MIHFHVLILLWVSHVGSYDGKWTQGCWVLLLSYQPQGHWEPNPSQEKEEEDSL